MGKNFWIPFTIIAGFAALGLLSGTYPIVMVLPELLLGLAVILIGRKTGGDWGKMMLWVLPLSLVLILLVLGLGLLMKYIPWVRAILMWPLEA